MSGGAQQAGLDAFVLDQRIQRHGGAVNAQLRVGQDGTDGLPHLFGNLRKALGNGTGAILRGGCGLEQMGVALVIGQNEIGECAASIDAQTISGHNVSLLQFLKWLMPGAAHRPCRSSSGCQPPRRTRAVRLAR